MKEFSTVSRNPDSDSIHQYLRTASVVAVTSRVDGAGILLNTVTGAFFGDSNCRIDIPTKGSHTYSRNVFGIMNELRRFKIIRLPGHNFRSDKKRMYIIHEQHYHRMQQVALIPGMLQRTQTFCGTGNSTEIQPFQRIVLLIYCNSI